MRNFAWIALLGTLPLVTAPPVAAQTRAGTYRIGPKDLIRVQVFEVEELRDLELRVDEAGDVRLPIVGDIAVTGLTAPQAAQRIEETLESQYVQQATVSVTVIEFRARPISVLGAVTEPGPLDFAGPWTLLEAITAAGGLAANHGSAVQILRRAENGLSDQLSVDLNALLAGDSSLNVPLQPDDLVTVAADVSLTVYCLGEVNAPGALEFRSSERFTLLAAIARAGGLSERASKRILIKRQQSPGEPEEIEVAFGDILAGRAADVPLENGDVIVVRESFF